MIDLTPIDVRKKKGDFRKALRGYEPALVDDFLDIVADRLDQLVRENAAMHENIKRLENQVADNRERERALTDALVTAQEMREEMRQQTAREAELMRRTAEQETAQLRSTVERQVAQLRMTAEQEVAQMRSSAEQESSRMRSDALKSREREEEVVRRLRARQQQLLQSYRTFLAREMAELQVIAETLEIESMSGDAVHVPSPHAEAFAPPVTPFAAPAVDDMFDAEPAFEPEPVDEFDVPETSFADQQIVGGMAVEASRVDDVALNDHVSDVDDFPITDTAAAHDMPAHEEAAGEAAAYENVAHHAADDDIISLDDVEPRAAYEPEEMFEPAMPTEEPPAMRMLDEPIGVSEPEEQPAFAGLFDEDEAVLEETPTIHESAIVMGAIELPVLDEDEEPFAPEPVDEWEDAADDLDGVSDDDEGIATEADEIGAPDHDAMVLLENALKAGYRLDLEDEDDAVEMDELLLDETDEEPGTQHDWLDKMIDDEER